jgi:hypothetical protein
MPARRCVRYLAYSIHHRWHLPSNDNRCADCYPRMRLARCIGRTNRIAHRRLLRIAYPRILGEVSRSCLYPR